MQDNHTGVLLEDIQSKLEALIEVTSTLAADVSVMKPQVALIPEMQADIRTLKAVQKDQGHDLKQVNSRLTHVETRLGNVETRLGHVEDKLGHVEDYLVMQGMPQGA